MVPKQLSCTARVAGLERFQNLLMIAYRFIPSSQNRQAEERARSARGSNMSCVAFSTPLRAKPTMAP
jgi:hypothetical protein